MYFLLQKLVDESAVCGSRKLYFWGDSVPLFKVADTYLWKLLGLFAGFSPFPIFCPSPFSIYGLMNLNHI